MVMAEVMALPLSAVTGIVMLPEPSKAVALPVAAPDRAIVRLAASLVAVAALPVQALAVVAVVAVDALPVRLALIVAGNFNTTLALPLTLTAVLVLVPSVIVMLRAVPQLAVVILAVPLNEVPLIVRAVCNFVAVAALPVHDPEDPVTEPTMGLEKVFVPAMV